MQQIIVYVEISLIAKETTMENNQNAIEVRNMSKDFKLVLKAVLVQHNVYQLFVFIFKIQ